VTERNLGRYGALRCLIWHKSEIMDIFLVDRNFPRYRPPVSSCHPRWLARWFDAATWPATPIASAYTLNAQRPMRCGTARTAVEAPLSPARIGVRLMGHRTAAAAGRFNACSRARPAGNHCAINVFPPRPVLTYHLLQCKSAPVPSHRTGQEAVFPLNGGVFRGRRGETSVYASELSPIGRRSRRPDGNLRGGSGLNETVSPPISVR
jgi:hypothetical protein